MTILVILLFLCITGNSQAQTCLPDGIAFTSQIAIDNFSQDYPGCEEIIIM